MMGGSMDEEDDLEDFLGNAIVLNTEPEEEGAEVVDDDQEDE